MVSGPALEPKQSIAATRFLSIKFHEPVTGSMMFFRLASTITLSLCIEMWCKKYDLRCSDHCFIYNDHHVRDNHTPKGTI